MLGRIDRSNHSTDPGSADDPMVPGFSERIVRRSTVIPDGNVFTEDIITMLPYHETQVMWEDLSPRTVLGSDVWSGLFVFSSIWIQ
ncbi:hypothetical protein NM688_g4394 [Phlebia brevispora]|uniref:Uncharacterized protein n=1 Tax=Phlebia brevispora TaxID=194682 RepID=A0ACC1T322_9APHY|nr:hypothetical protein NM688_g4394 [Phlebia brevispora]